ncbi:MAG: hypothetical protein JRI68_22740 [Deltaproteobacteria bacterium]|nr:hypothetical protein [Deltaproteobacteria bacterium]
MTRSALRPTLIASAVLLLIAAPACDGGKAGSGAAATASATSTAAASATAQPTAPATATAATAAAAASVAPTATPTIPGRTPVPTTEEWNGVGEITVKGSSALNCETKMVREWLRVTCRGKNDTGGTPTRVSVTEGQKPGVFHYASGRVTSLIMPYVTHTHLEAIFSWTDKAHKLVVDWPNAAPKPPVIGVFEGAKSPLDRLAGAGDAKLMEYACQCATEDFDSDLPEAEKRHFIALCVKEALALPHADCQYTYPKDCKRYDACTMNEPGSPSRCRPGHLRVLLNTCGKPCKSDSDCPKDRTCLPTIADESVSACFGV